MPGDDDTLTFKACPAETLQKRRRKKNWTWMSGSLPLHVLEGLRGSSAAEIADIPSLSKSRQTQPP